jgi:hypothetical protein
MSKTALVDFKRLGVGLQCGPGSGPTDPPKDSEAEWEALLAAPERTTPGFGGSASPESQSEPSGAIARTGWPVTSAINSKSRS